MNPTQHNCQPRCFWLAAMLVALSAVPAMAALPPAGTPIGNQATATYLDGSNTLRNASSNVVQTIVNQVYAVDLIDPRSRIGTDGSFIYFPHTVTNLGNGPDTFSLAAINQAGDDFNLSNLLIYLDANGDGVPDNFTPLTSTTVIPAGGSFSFVVVGTMPVGGLIAGDQAQVLVTATSTNDPAATDSNLDTVTYTADAVIDVGKAFSANQGIPGFSPLTVTFTYTNSGNNTGHYLVIEDEIPVGMTYVDGSAIWSVGGGTSLTDNELGVANQQTVVGRTIDFEYDAINRKVTAIVFSVPPSDSGTITFQVTIDDPLAPQVIPNTAQFGYDTADDGDPYNAPDVPFADTNTVQFTVLQIADVEWTQPGPTLANASAGQTILFENILTNTGNGTDTFDITLTGSNFPAGTVFNILNSGQAPMQDSNGNGIPDTGPVAAGATYSVWLQVTLPNNAPNGGGPYAVNKVATSGFNPTVTDTVTDTLTEVIGAAVDLTLNQARTDTLPAGTAELANAATTGFGPLSSDNLAAPTETQSTNPGTQVIFNLKVNNIGPNADSYNLQVSTDSTFATQTLPAGWSVVFREGAPAGPIVSSTGTINEGVTPSANSNKTFYAVVSVPANEAPQTVDLYFRALSPISSTADRLRVAVTVNTVRLLELVTDNQGQAFPNGSVEYVHFLRNLGNVTEGAAIDLTDAEQSRILMTAVNDQGNFNSILYFDANNNGVLDPADPVITPSTALASLGGALADGLQPGEQVRLFVRVLVGPGAPDGLQNITTITATATNAAAATIAAPPPVVNFDTTTVITSDIEMEKFQSLDGITYTKLLQNADPGAVIYYRVLVTNSGSTTATNVVVTDTLPTYTTAENPPVPTVTGGTVNTANLVGTQYTFDIGTLTAGATATIEFAVRINN